MSLLLLFHGPGATVSGVRTATLTVTPRITGLLGMDPIGNPQRPDSAGVCVAQEIHRVTVSGVATLAGALLTSASTYLEVSVQDAVSAAVYYAPTTMSPDSAGQWHADVPASAFPVGTAVILSVGIYDLQSTDLLRTLAQTLYPLAPTLLRAAAQSANRIDVGAVADLGTLQDSSTTACSLTVTDASQSVLVADQACDYAGGNTWTYDAPRSVFAPGAALSLQVAVWDQTKTTRRGSLYGVALAA